MENAFVSMFLICFLSVISCYAATVVMVRKFMPNDWGWNNVQALDERVWEAEIPVLVRRLYVLAIFFSVLGAVFMAGLALMRGDVIGIVFSMVVVIGLTYKVARIWRSYRGQF